MRLGLHLSSRGGVVAALETARRLQTCVAQMFIGNPRAWNVSELVSANAAADASSAAKRLSVEWFVHLPYLINVASPDADLYEKSRKALLDYCKTATHMGAKGVVLHVGNHRGVGFTRVRAQIANALSACTEFIGNGSVLLLENAAGQRGAVGSALDELWRLLNDLPRDKFGLCLDTAHLMGAGIEFRTEKGLDWLLGDLNNQIGIDRLGLIHLNDSKRSLGSGRDLHENLGYGSVGVGGLVPLLRHKVLAAVPMVLEVPGLDGAGPDEANLEVALTIARGSIPSVRSSFQEQMPLEW